ncbi:MAG: FecR domain-containing protein [Deltaproteobacteria bacterium]|nr:FecR domain-containing protein [Deltaproteobacteria bacterium]
MSRIGPDCRRARRDLIKQDSLDAVGRGWLDLHLRRCPECAVLAAGLAQIEKARELPPPITEESTRKIYDRLVPVVHEIAVDLAHPAKPWYTRRAVTWGAGLAAAAALLVAFAFLGAEPEPTQTETRPQAMAQADRGAPTTHDGLVDRCEGVVKLDGLKISAGDGKFDVRQGTEIEVDDNARLAFRIDDAARVAVVGETSWHISVATETLIEMVLDKGRLAVEYDGTSGRALDVRTPDSLVRVRGTVFTVEVVPDEGTRVSVLEGKVEVVPRGSGSVVELDEGELVSMPGGEHGPIEDTQRALAAEVDALDDYLAYLGRLVVFDGSPERVKVEVDGRVLGSTPLVARLPDGPVSYRLTAPGMEPLEGTLIDEQEGDAIAFALAPAPDYQPAVTLAPQEPQSTRVDKPSAAGKASLGVRWDLFQRARAAITAGDIPYAAGLLERAIEGAEGERLVTGLAMLAECYAAVGRYREAANAFDRVAALVPATAVAQNSRYEVARLSMDRLGDFGRARAAFTAYVASPLGGALKEEAYYSLCELDAREGAHRDALLCFNEFLRSYPGGRSAPNARLWRGALFQDVERRWAEAERDLKAFIEAKPRHPRAEEARYRVALGRYQTGDRRGSLRAIEEYLGKHPSGQFSVRAQRLRQAILDPDFSWEPDSK